MLGRVLWQRCLSSGSALGAHSSNIGETIRRRMGRDLHRVENHPIGILKRIIADYFDEAHPSAPFELVDDLLPEVTVWQNFDSLLFPGDHVSRSPSDTYYFEGHHTLLRTHTSAHQSDLLRSGRRRFLVAGDVYRRDEVDAQHYPVFHQMEGVRVFSPQELSGDPQQQALADLKSVLEGLARRLFGDVPMQWVDAYFPFTEPSLELEIQFQGRWLEVLGCGIVHQGIMEASGVGHLTGWAFGLGLDRLAMILFDIPDIRLFWSEDPRFLSQFQAGQIRKFVPFSRYPPCHKDISFWLPQDESAYHPNDLMELARDVAGDLVEEVLLTDTFTHPKTQRKSVCYRINYRSMERSLTNEEVDQLQQTLRERVQRELSVDLR